MQDEFYPSSDGKPMAESDLHRKEMMYLIEALEGWYEDAPDVYVSGNLLLYYVRGDRNYVVAPDVFVVKGITKRNRDLYKLWEEGRGPAFVIEVTSDSTRDEDLGRKRSLYEQWGVEEYFLHDPDEDYLKPGLQGYRLVNGRYQKIVPEADGTLLSRTTGLRLRRDGNHLRLIDPATGTPLPGIEELREAVWRLRRELEARGSS
ncbi:MAG TPA: Uma2 family endonuclease [Thermoanaerobaculia bacterium]|jgi:Uma2 family endonuclease|nr:Uma2 family endonuclease [Thermoanaerobaculia bacterium]